MSDDAKLQKVILGPDWIDLSFGEPTVVCQALTQTLNRFGSPFQMPTFSDINKWTYQPAAGNPELVALLEKKYDARVVVTNGAKQALAAVLHSLHLDKTTSKTIFFDIPFYPANPGFVESAGFTRTELAEADCALITSPNNPDGKCYSNIELLQFQTQLPTIHDAAYYTPIYLPQDQIPIPIGKAQIFSMSKMYGISGLRIGYAVCHDEKLYKPIVDYMEETTAGVSTASQQIALEIEKHFKENRSWQEEFEGKARNAIIAARKELEALNPDVLTVIPCQSNSMFAWCIAGSKLDNVKAKVHILPGSIFGQPGMMRMNIAHPPEVIKEAVRRLNEHIRE